MSATARVPGWLRLAVSLGLLLGLVVWLEPGELVARLRDLDPRWVALALGLSVLQVMLSAWRWQFTSGRLGVPLGYGLALREYYLASFVNQVVPGGVMGDAARAWRHGRAHSGGGLPEGRAVRAVVLERASGQVVMAAVALASLPWLPLSLPARAGVAAAAALVVIVGAAAWRRVRRAGGDDSLRARVVGELRVALLARQAWPAQLGSSALVVASYLAVYLMAARSVGVQAPAAELLPLVAPVLVAMLVPVTVAGWGLREGAAALVWQAAGRTSAEGVMVSVAYGLIVLVSTLPGALVLLASSRNRR